MQKADNNMLIRAYIIYFVVFLVSVAIVARVVYLQFVKGDELREKAQNISMQYVEIESDRGNIYDCNNLLMATTIPFFELRFDAASPLISDSVFDANIDSLAICLSKYFKNNTQKQYKSLISAERKKGNRYYLLKRSITYDDLTEIRKFPIFCMGTNSGGLIIKQTNKRVYPYGELALRVVGFYSKEKPNIGGVEGAFDKHLAGVNGQKLFQRIPGRYWKPIESENQIEAENGLDIITTIDINLQDVTEKALREQLEKNQADHGCAIVMEVATGEIKAMANLGRTKEGNYKETYNYAIGESAEPGSTFKTMSMLAAFEDSDIKLTDNVNVEGGTTRFANRVMRDSHLGDQMLTVEQVFNKSSNVGVSKIITQIYNANPQKYIDRLYSFGINKPIGLELGGEANPYIKSTDSKYWSKVSLPWMSIGYEVALTPLQILNFYNAIANNGTMMKPYFVKAIMKNGEVVEEFKPQILNEKIASQKAIDLVRSILETAVSKGTGSAVRTNIYKFAGKTGTAQIAQKSAGYNKSNYKGTFAGYFPADNPKYSLIVVITNPTQAGYYGGAISAPVVREIADRLYASDPTVGLQWVDSSNTSRNNPINAGYTEDIQKLSNWLGYSSKAYENLQWLSSANDSVKGKAIDETIGIMPNIIGLGAKDAIYLLEKKGVVVNVIGKGIVASQSPIAGTPINFGGLVTINLSLKN